MNFYLYQRQWLQRLNFPNGDYRTSPWAAQFSDRMSRFINVARRERLTRLQGIMPIETNLNGTAELQNRSLYVARRINARTQGWLKTHTFMFPGAGMGSYFKGIQLNATQWLTQMKPETGYFALIYKHMRSQPGGVNRLERLNDRWKYYVGRGSTASVARQVRYLNDEMGLADLAYISRHHRAQFPRHTQVVFWGDAADGVCWLSGLSDQRYNYNTMRALHRILVEQNNWRGHIFNTPFTSTEAEKCDLWKYMITVEPRTHHRARNFAWNHSRTHRVWDEWQGWADPRFRY